VRAWEARDAIYTQGAIDLLGLLFAGLGIGTFLLRPWTSDGWALLALSTISGSVLMMLYVSSTQPWVVLYSISVVGFVYVAPLHAALAYPVPHRRLVRGPGALVAVYGLGVVAAGLNVANYLTDGTTGMKWATTLGPGLMLASILAFGGRCAYSAVQARGTVAGRRARIVLVGVVFGFVPVGLAVLLQNGFGVLSLDLRFAYWSLVFLYAALVRATLRPELENARIAVRRAVMYAGAVALLTTTAVWISAFSPWAVAALLFPLLYSWPRFSRRLDARLYPKRARIPEIMRAVGREMALATDVPGVLRVLADAPERLLDASSAVVITLPGGFGGDRTEYAAHGPEPLAGEPLEDETLLRLLVATRTEIARSAITVQPQLSVVRDEIEAGLDRLHAQVVLPMLDERDAVAGALAVGARKSGDPYEEFELDALGSLMQQACAALDSVRAMDRLRRRELDFADLKRFFPPQIIERVMAEGSDLKLRRERKLVTIVFADLRGFTSFADSVEPEELIAMLNEYHEAMGASVAGWQGTLERFTGDGFMVFFNDPVEQKDHVERAVRMAFDMREMMTRLREGWARRGYDIDMGIGIHTGYATCGFIGYEGRRDYGVIGTVTNLAARLSDAASGGEILISTQVRAELPEGRYVLEPRGQLALKGFAQAQNVYRAQSLI
jgi:class 3 adenylate cyclase